MRGDIPKNQLRNRGEYLVQNVECDVALTVETGTKTGGGIEVVGGILGAGTKGQTTAEKASLHRIKFSIPLQFKQES